MLNRHIFLSVKFFCQTYRQEEFTDRTAIGTDRGTDFWYTDPGSGTGSLEGIGTVFIGKRLVEAGDTNVIVLPDLATIPE